MALTKVTGQVINTSTDVTVGVLTVTNTLAVGGTVSIGGTLTYEDVTNIDSVGLITARNGIVVGSGITLSSDGDVFAVGVSTFNGNVLVGSGITLSPDGDGFFTGITTTTSFKVGTGITFSSSSASFGGGVLQENYDNHGALTGTHNHDAHTHGMILRSSTNASASFVINLRGDATTTFGSLFPYPKATTMTIYSPSNNASYYMTAFQIDGSAQTIKWSGGSAPTAGNASSNDVYTYTIIKTGDAAFTALAALTQFA